MSFHHSPTIIHDSSLVLCLDAANKKSYPGTGSVWTDLSKKYSGTLINSPSYSSANGGILYFANQNTYCSVGALNEDFSNFTVIIWYKAVTNFSYQNLLDCNVNAFGGISGNIGPRLEINGAGGWGFVYSNITYDNDAHNYTSNGGTLLADSWYMLAMTLNSTTGAVFSYVNGVQSTAGNGDTGNGSTQGQFVNTMQNVQIGCGFYGGRYSDSYIPIVQIYNRDLSSDEITQNFNAVRGRFGL